jgi:hypothetical protein
MITREAIIECGKSWCGTPTRHQGQVKGVGTDCKGMIVGIGVELGLPEAQTIHAKARDYSKGFSGKRFLEGIADSLIRVEIPEPADVLAIMFGRDPYPRHLALLSKPGWIIHAYFGAQFVAEVPLGHYRVHSAWSWPSLRDGNG